MDFQDFILIASSFLGFISLCKTFIKFLRWVWVMFLRPPKNLKDYGSWAMITGSTDGIGKALAFELASNGLNVILVGRSPSKLEATSKEIQERYGGQVETKSIVIDLETFSGEEIVKTIGEGSKGLDVGILINNAGVAYPYARFFHEVDLELMNSVIKVNLEGPTWVTRSVLPGMLKKRKGAIINIGSGSCAISSYPLVTVYAATKAYVAMFSRSIGLEYKKNGIDVQCQVPFLVATKMTKLKKSGFLAPSSEMYSKASIRWIGYEYLCIPYWAHSLHCFIMNALPVALSDWFILQFFLPMRKRGLLKEYSKTAKLQVQ